MNNSCSSTSNGSPAAAAYLQDFSEQQIVDIIVLDTPTGDVMLVTTHNPTVLNALESEDIPGVVVCYRDAKDVQLYSDKFQSDEIAMLMDRFQVGHLGIRDFFKKYRRFLTAATG